MLEDDWYHLHKKDEPGTENAPGFRKKWNNWWYYNKWYVLVIALVAVLVFDFVHSVHENKANRPDFQVAYLGGALNDDTVEKLEQALAELAPDSNGDGQVIVTVNQYNLYSGKEGPQLGLDPAAMIAAQTRMAADLQAGESFLFLTPDPIQFQEDTGVLCRIDGTLPEEDPDSAMPLYLAWEDCPVLESLDLGLLTDPMLEEGTGIENQALMQHLYLGRRYISPDTDPVFCHSCARFWSVLTAGASIT